MAKTIRQTFNLCNQQVLSNCYSFIAEHYQQQDDSKRLTATIELMNKNKARSLAQNRLYWEWVGYLSDKIGNTKDEQHTLMKRKHLTPIFMADDREFAEMVLSLQEYRKHATQAEYEPLAAGVAQLMSTTKATVTQMSSYLDAIDKYYYSKGYALPKPEDYMWIRGE